MSYACHFLAIYCFNNLCCLEKMWSLLGINHRHIHFWSLYCLNCKCFLCFSTMNSVCNSTVWSKRQDIDLSQHFLLMLSPCFMNFLSDFCLQFDAKCSCKASLDKVILITVISMSLVWWAATKWGSRCSDVGGKILWCKCCFQCVISRCDIDLMT